MKKLIFLFIFLFFSISAWGFGSNYKVVKDRAIEIVEADQEPAQCPVHSETPFSEIHRADIDLEIRFNFLDSPSGGESQFYMTENLDFKINYNVTSGWYGYTWYGQRKTEKENYPDSDYDPDWESRMLFAGMGIYLTPVIKIFAGGGKIWLENENGEDVTDKIGTAVERGFSMDVPWGNNKFVLSYRIIDAQKDLDDDEEKSIKDSQMDGSFNTIGIAFSVPFMR